MSGVDCMERSFVNYLIKLEVKIFLVYAQVYTLHLAANNAFQINWLKI